MHFSIELHVEEGAHSYYCDKTSAVVTRQRLRVSWL